jgi:hypothetical protein
MAARSRAHEGELQEMRQFHAELLRYAIRRRYRSAWIGKAFRERFGVKPPAECARANEATWIRPETFRWIRARVAAYAKSVESGERPGCEHGTRA